MFFWSQHHRAELLWRGTSSGLGRCEGQAPGFCQPCELISPPRGLCRKGRSGIPRFNSTHCPSFPAQDWSAYNGSKALGTGCLLPAGLKWSDIWANGWLFSWFKNLSLNHILQCKLLVSVHIPQDWFWPENWPCRHHQRHAKCEPKILFSQTVHAKFHSLQMEVQMEVQMKNGEKIIFNWNN